jgi:hypothetical protein
MPNRYLRLDVRSKNPSSRAEQAWRARYNAARTGRPCQPPTAAPDADCYRAGYAEGAHIAPNVQPLTAAG